MNISLRLFYLVVVGVMVVGVYREVEAILFKGGHYFLEQSVHIHTHQKTETFPHSLAAIMANSCSSGRSPEVKSVCSIIRWLLSRINTFPAPAKTAPSVNADRQIG